MSRGTRCLALLLSSCAAVAAAGAATFDVLDFGAAGDNETDDGAAIAAAYRACREAGGGTVLFRGGGGGGGGGERIYGTGPVALACNDSVMLLEPGATLAARNSSAGWPLGPDSPEPAQGRTARQMAPLLHVDHGRNVSVVGGGALDAEGEVWWREACGNWWCPPGFNHTSPRAFRPFLLRADGTRGLVVRNVTMRNPGFWNLVPVHSHGIVIEDVNVSARWSSSEAAAAADRGGAGQHADPYGSTPNTDGFEPMWSSDVLVRRCRVLNGDDCITIKSGSRDVLVEDLYCEHGDGLTIGSVWYDDVTNVTYRRVTMNRTHNGPMIKGRSQGNATVSGITFEDITLIDVYLALTVDCDYETPGAVVPNSGVRVWDVTFRNITGTVCLPRPRGAAAADGAANGAVGGDPSFLVDAAGTFFCRPEHPCSLALVDVSVRHSSNANATPPAWKCNSSDIAATRVSPGLPGACVPAL